MRVLLIGSGAREHALALGLAADPAVSELVVAPGNPGIADLVQVCPVTATDPVAVAGLAARLRAELVVVGPEAPLVAGVADAVRATGIACFGPSAGAARIEGSKSFAKEVMAAAGVPTAVARTCTTAGAVAAALDQLGPPFVVKADGLAAGKGVLVTTDRAAALGHAQRCGRVVVEGYLDGPEVSLFVVTDGGAALPLLPAQDFKRLAEGDRGPNTGGMGAYCPLPWLPPSLVDDVMATVVTPTLAELRRRGVPFVGLLYVGLALTAAGPRVVEFNARFGDPETEVVLPLLATPLATLLHAAATRQLAGHGPLRWHPGAAVTVVVAASGYPDSPVTGLAVTGADRVPGVLHAGTVRGPDGALRSAGGRVLACTATGDDLASARHHAYELVDRIGLAGAQVRRDIALAAAQGHIRVPAGPVPSGPVPSSPLAGSVG
jgi:phosphoribosylamine---glycine ligase